MLLAVLLLREGRLELRELRADSLLQAHLALPQARRHVTRDLTAATLQVFDLAVDVCAQALVVREPGVDALPDLRQAALQVPLERLGALARHRIDALEPLVRDREEGAEIGLHALLQPFLCRLD